MSRRATLITFAVAAVLALAGLLAAAAGDGRPLAFTPNTADNLPVILLARGEQLCQGPITVLRTADAVEFLAMPAQALTVEVRRSPGRRLISSRRIAVRPTLTGAITVALRRLHAHERIDICMRNLGRQPLAFEGGPPTPSSGTILYAGQRLNAAVALVFLRNDPPSLLSQLPEVFRRAALFKLDGVRAWTFWLLAAALLGAFGLAGVAVAGAAQADGERADGERADGEPEGAP